MSGPFLSVYEPAPAPPARRPGRRLAVVARSRAPARGDVRRRRARSSAVASRAGRRSAGVDVGGLTEAEARDAVVRAAAAVASTGRSGSSRPSGTMTTRRCGAARHAAGRRRARGGARRRHRRSACSRGSASATARARARVPARARCRRPSWRTGSIGASASRGATPSVVVRGRRLRVVEARPGTGVDRGGLRRALRTLPATRGALDRAGRARRLDRARPRPPRRASSGCSTAHGRVGSATRSRRSRRGRLRALVRTEREDGSLGVVLDPKGLHASLRPRLGRFEVSPRDATFWAGAQARAVSSRRVRARRSTSSGSRARSPRTSTRRRISPASHVAAPAFTTEDCRGARHPRARSRSSRPTTSAASRA